jgi:hypothetical protein
MYEVQAGINNKIRNDSTIMTMLGGRGPFYGRIPKDSPHNQDVAAIYMETESIIEPGGKENQIVTLHSFAFRKMMNELVSKQIDRLFHDYRLRWVPLTLVTGAAPSLVVSSSGGSLPTGNISVKLGPVFGPEELSGTLESSVAVVGPNGIVTVTIPKLQDGQTFWNVFFGTTPGGESLFIQTAPPAGQTGSVVIQQLSAGVQANGLTVASGSPKVNSVAFTRIDFRVDVTDPASELYHKVIRIRVRYGHSPTAG